MTGARRTLLRALAVVSAALVLAGCATIPRSGSVQGGTEIHADDNGFDTFDYIPSGPVDGMTQEQILRGFVRAALSPQDRYQTARSFLTPQFADRWKPDVSVTVDTGTGRNYRELDDSSWQLSVEPQAFVDSDGDYREADSTSPIAQPYKFQKIGGQWRISHAPDGTIIDSTSFGNVFSAHTLYFFDPTGRFLVPNQRWFPSGTSTPTRVVKALLAGPSDWLKGAVTTAFPQGTDLGFDSVRVSGGTAQVALGSAANAADAGQLQRMKLQLQRSLADTTSGQSVSISIDGVEAAIPAPQSPPIQDPKVDSRPLVLKGADFGFLSGTSIAPLPALSEPIAALHGSSAVVSADHTTAAVFAEGRVVVVRQGSSAVVDDRPGVLPAALDPAGFVWSVPASDPAAMRVTGPDGVSHPVETTWPDATGIRGIRVSRDGTRLAAVLQTEDEMRLVVAAVIRDDKGVPQRLGEPLELGALGSAQPASLAWVDQLTVAVLTTSSDGESTIRSQVVGGQAHTVAGPPAGWAIVGAGGLPPYWVLTAEGSLQAARGTGWQERADGVTLVAAQLGVPR